jgi:hypothetical protein
VHSLYRSSTRRPEDDSVQSKHVAPLSHYMFNITTVVFDGPSPPFTSNNNINEYKKQYKIIIKIMLLCSIFSFG